MGRMELISSYAWKKNDNDVNGKSVGQSEGRGREKSDKNGIETLIPFLTDSEEQILFYEYSIEQ